jgi:hypothetical protein
VDYAFAQTPDTPRAVPELGRLKAAAERIARARSDLECFVGRFNGGSNCIGGGVCGEPETDSYRNDIGALFDQVERLEKAVELLRDIG